MSGLGLVAAALVAAPALQPAAPAAAAGCSLTGIAGNTGTLGSSSNPFAISSSADLASLMDCSGVANHFEVTADIDLGGDSSDPSTAWTPLGSWATPFNGVIDGAGHTIRNLFVSGTTQNRGLFGSLGTGEIRDLSLVGEAVSESDYVGLLAGSVVGTAVINNVDIVGSVSGLEEVGLMMGAFYPDAANPPHTLLITGSEVSGQTNARAVVGGFIGAFYGNNDTESLEINNSRADLEHRYFVPNQGSGSPYGIGGLIGLTIGGDEVVISTSDVVVDIDITSSLHAGGDGIGGALGDVRDQSLAIHSVQVVGDVVDNNFETTSVGGLVGHSRSLDKSIQQSVFSGRVVGEWGVGGLVGQEFGKLDGTSAISGSQSHGEVVGRLDSGGLVGYAQIVRGGSLTLTDLANFATVTSDAFPGDPGYSISTHAGSFGGLVGVISAENFATNAGDIDVSNRAVLMLRRSANYASVVSPGEYAGGIVGDIYSFPGDVKLEDVANYGSVVGLLRSAGIAGRANLYRHTVINLPALMQFERVFSSAASVTASSSGAVAGVVAQVRIGTAPDDLVISQHSGSSTVFWNHEASGITNDAASGTVHRSSSELASITTYSAAGFDISAGWSLNSSPSTIWGICAGFNAGVPFLNSHFKTDPCIQAQAPAASYSGPVVMAISDRTVTSCTETELSITGLRLAGATVSIQGVATEVLATSDSELRVLVPAGLTAEQGADLVIATGLGNLRYQGAVDVLAECQAQITAWTRALDDGTVKFYARGVVGSGKVRFVLNGREIAWVRAIDATDPRLNVGPAAARDGLVRTVGPGSRWSLAAGRNVLEIYVGENRLVRRIFTQ